MLPEVHDPREEGTRREDHRTCLEVYPERRIHTLHPTLLDLQMGHRILP